MKPGDVTDVVRVHMESFPNFFLTRLGARFLELFYGECVRTGAITCVAVRDDRIVGFAVGSENPRGFYRRLLARRIPWFGLAAVPALARDPRIAARIIRAFLLARSAHPSGEATLMSLAVQPRWREHGIGAQLVRAFTVEAARRGASTVNLLTERDANDATNEFYRRIGFRLARELSRGRGPAMNEYELELQKS